MEDVLQPGVRLDANNDQFNNNVEINYMFAPEWQPDPVFQNHMSRMRNAQFYRLWANYFAPVGTPELSVKISKPWSSFLSNLLQPESFNWS